MSLVYSRRQKAQSTSEHAKFLGEASRFEGNPDKFATLPTNERVASIVAEVQNIFHAGEVTSGTLASCRGRLLHLSASMAGRIGYSLTFHATLQLAQENPAVTHTLRRELEWALGLIDFKP